MIIGDITKLPTDDCLCRIRVAVHPMKAVVVFHLGGRATLPRSFICWSHGGTLGASALARATASRACARSAN
eukprot:scaffold394641_cov34-Prasinocladus_malaysianus.AAC.1